MPPVVVMDLPAGMELEPRPRPDGGSLYSVSGPAVRDLPSMAGVAVDVIPAADLDAAESLADAAVASLDASSRLIDRAPCAVADEPAVRTLVVTEVAGLVAVVLEQWWLVTRGSRITLTATADLASWAALAPLLRQAVASARLEPS